MSEPAEAQDKQIPSAVDLFAEMLKPRPKRAEYADSPEVQELGEEVIKKHSMIDASQARIKYLFKISEKSRTAGKCYKADKKWNFLTGYDYVVEMWHPWWSDATSFEREALMFHELSHIIRVETKKGIKWALRDHTIEAFHEEVDLYGAWSPQLQQLKEIFNARQTRESIGDIKISPVPASPEDFVE